MDQAKVVDSVLGLSTHRLVMSLAEGDGPPCYSFQADNRNKLPRKYLLPQSMLLSHSAVTSDSYDRVLKDSLYGLCEGLHSWAECDKQAHLSYKASMLCLENGLHEHLAASIPRYELRIVGGVEELHGLRNSMLLLVDTLGALEGLAASYASQPRTHRDRVQFLLPVPLQAFVGQSFGQFSDYVAGMLRFRNAMVRDKVHVHFHVQHIFWPGINHLWKSSACAAVGGDANADVDADVPAAGAAEAAVGVESLFHLHDLTQADSSGAVGVLLTVEVSGSRLTIDLPGGKRELGETSLECAYRETWEEVGIDLRPAAIRPMWRAAEWTIVQHHVHHGMACFQAFGASLLASLPAMYSARTKITG